MSSFEHDNFFMLQRALYASMNETLFPARSSTIQTLRTKPPITLFRREPQSSTTAPATTSQSAFTDKHRQANLTKHAPRRNTLMREGISPSTNNTATSPGRSPPKGAPVPRNQNKSPVETSKTTTGALGEVQWEVKLEKKAKRQRPVIPSLENTSEIATSASSTSSSNTCPSPTSNPTSTACTSRSSSSLKVTKANEKWWEFWLERNGRGKLASNEEKQMISLESTSPHSVYFCTYEDESSTALVATGSYNVNLQAKCPKATDAQLFIILLDFAPVSSKSSTKKGNRFIQITMNASHRWWKIEKIVGTTTTVIGQAIDRKLIASKFNRISIQVRGSKFSLINNDRVVCNEISATDESELLTGKVGVGVQQSKAIVADFHIEKYEIDPGTVIDRPLPSGVDRVLAEMIRSDIIQHDLNVTFDQIAELGNAKKLLKEAAILPILIPEFFTGLRKPWKGILLFGPPGTGKTMLAKAVASQAKTTFFNISASSIVSKWVGESERLVKCLFQLARHYSPSTIFFDEIDALMMSRGGGTEHESSRRLKSELLSQIDGINSTNDKLVMVLATTNKPWDLDEAMRRRLEKRIYVPLPDKVAREEMFKLFLANIELDPDVSFRELAAMCEGHSGADIHLICRDASMMPMRRQIADKSTDEIIEMKSKGQLNFVLTMNDFKMAIKNTQPSVSNAELVRYDQWTKEFAST